MRVVIAGGHGQIALLLAHQLAAAGDQPVSLIRNPEHVADVEQAGGWPVVFDLESGSAQQLSVHLAAADAVVFAAGAGPNSGAERKQTVDRDGAVLLAEAARIAGVRRYVIVSALGTDDYDPDSDDVFQVYLRAKSEADAALRATDLDWTVVRPGGLTDEEPTGRVTVATSTGRGQVPRADVAAVVRACLTQPATIGHQFELIGGETPIADALSALVG
ncbi:NAD(P)H-binding protein [uncultured Jatrophihabitans sp.]|uniref:NAD(P)H-binding protein n=1 Tax=uncultured Jatrophihabitans sp. TaxID=1610747 RepID=UPI0035CC6226